MKLLLDENLPFAVESALQSAGFDIRKVSEETPRAVDDAVLAGAERSSQIVVTSDKDFGELVYRRQHAFHGVVLIRCHPISDHIDWIIQVLSEHQVELAGAFVVIAPHKVRIRRRPTAQ